MSLILNSRPLVVIPELAEAIGLNEAIIIQQIHYWCADGRSTVRHDGINWVYNTYEQWQEQFPFFSDRTIRRALKSLQDQGLVFVEQLNKSRHDRTNFYSVNYGRIDEVSEAVSNRPNWPHPQGQDGRISTETTTETTTKINTSSFDDECASAFETYWSAGMKKIGKKSALAKFKAYVKKHKADPQQFAVQLFTDVQKRISSGQFGFDKMHPVTYLNQERWNDEISTATSTPSNQPAGDIHSQRQAKLDEWERQMHAAGHGQCQDALGSNGGDLWGQMDEGQRGDAADRPAITLDDSDWQAG